MNFSIVGKGQHTGASVKTISMLNISQASSLFCFLFKQIFMMPSSAAEYSPSVCPETVNYDSDVNMRQILECIQSSCPLCISSCMGLWVYKDTDIKPSNVITQCLSKVQWGCLNRELLLTIKPEN